MALRKAYYFHGLTSNNTNKLNTTWLKEVNTKDRKYEVKQGWCWILEKCMRNANTTMMTMAMTITVTIDEWQKYLCMLYPQKKSIAMIYGWRLSNIKRYIHFSSFDTQSYTRKLLLSLSLSVFLFIFIASTKRFWFILIIIIITKARMNHDFLAYSQCPMNDTNALYLNSIFLTLLNRQYT